MIVGDEVKTTAAWSEMYVANLRGRIIEIVTDPRRIRPGTLNAYGKLCSRTHRVKIYPDCMEAEMFVNFNYIATFCPEDLELIV